MSTPYFSVLISQIRSLSHRPHGVYQASANTQHMYITREDYESKPLLVQEGALILWGIPLATWIDGDYVRHIYRLNEFYAELCYDHYTGSLMSVATLACSLQVEELNLV